MKIGIVSAQKHCKTHLTQLKRDGHEVYCLGARPQRIPASYDVLIVRVASMRHCDSYKEWAKTTGRPVIYEDGLSGARRELAKIEAEAQTTTPKLATAAISVQEVLEQMLEWGAVLLDARPLSNNRDLSRHLSTMLREQFPSMASNSKALVASVVAQLTIPSSMDAAVPETAPPEAVDADPTPTGPEPVQAEEPPVLEYPSQNTPFPAASEAWCKVYTQSKLKTAYKQAVECLAIMNMASQSSLTKAVLCREFKKAEKGRKMTKTVAKQMVPLVKGKPLAYVMLMYLAMPEDHVFVKQAFYASYKQITGKGSDTRLWKAVEWYLGREEPIHTPSTIDIQKGMKSNKPEAKTLQPGEPLAALPEGFQVNPAPAPAPKKPKATKATKAALAEPTADSNTNAILEMLEDLATIRDRLTALEDGGPTTTPDQVKDAVAQAVEAMREGLRSDIADAFDALAAEQPQRDVDLATSPFMALEQVKAMLKAAGFRGTLTLTIE